MRSKKTKTDKAVGQAEIGAEMNVGVRQVQHYKQDGLLDFLEKDGRKDASVVQSLWPVMDYVEAKTHPGQVAAGKKSGVRRQLPGSGTSATNATEAIATDAPQMPPPSGSWPLK
jgi:hypothetical protein